MAEEEEKVWVDVYVDKAGEGRWRRIRSRGNLPDEIVADSGEGYSGSTEAEALRAALSAAHRENEGIPVVMRAKESE